MARRSCGRPERNAWAACRRVARMNRCGRIDPSMRPACNHSRMLDMSTRSPGLQRHAGGGGAGRWATAGQCIPHPASRRARDNACSAESRRHARPGRTHDVRGRAMSRHTRRTAAAYDRLKRYRRRGSVVSSITRSGRRACAGQCSRPGGRWTGPTASSSAGIGASNPFSIIT